MTKFALYKSKSSIIFPGDAELPESVPTRTFEYRGRQLKACQDNLKNYYALKQVIPELECPIYRMDWPLYKNRFQPMEHQKHTSAFVIDNPKQLILNSTGTGKTMSVLFAFKYLKDQGLVDKLLVISPISVMQVWQQELFGSFLEYQNVVLYGSAAQRRELLKHDVEVFITNFDGLKVLSKELVEFVNERTYVVVDEASKLNNAKTQVYEIFEKIAKKITYMSLATATPAAKNPSQAWGLARLTNPETPKWFGKFRDLVQFKVTPFIWANKKDCNDVVNKYLQPSIMFHKDQCLDLPPLTIQYLEIPLSDEQDKVYKRVKKEMTARLACGEDITASNAAHTIGILRQTALGVVKVGDDHYEPIDKDAEGHQKMTPRLQAIMDVAESEDGKLIVVVPFKGAILHYHSVISKEFDCEYVNGDVGKNERNTIFDDFQNTDRIKVLLVHEQVASHGVNLQLRCSHLLFAGPIFSADSSIQLRGRIEREGAKKAMTITRIFATPLEKQIYERIDDRDYTQRELLEMYKQNVDNL